MIGESTMNLKIIKLTKGMGKEFADYFENLDFSHEPHYAGCFCRFYYDNSGIEEWQQRTGEHNKKEAIEEIDKGNMTGFLAYDADKCIGWLNADSSKSYKRLHEYIDEYVKGKNVAVAICYVIHPKYRSMGVAKAMLNHAISYFKNEGYDAMMVLPMNANEFSQKMYRGTVSMYEKAGFQKKGEFDYGQVYMLDFK